jgi:carbamoyltransferase
MLSKQLTHKTLIKYHANIGHLFVPNLLMRQPYSEKPHFVKTNQQGFRSNIDFEAEKKKDELRIVFIGDSYTAGEGVANEMRFSDLMCKQLGATCYNFGLSASGIDQQYLIYKDIAQHYEHDVLVLSPHIINIFRNTISERLSIESQTGKMLMVPKPYFTLKNDKLCRHNYPVPLKRREIVKHVQREKLINPGEWAKKMFHQYLPKRIKEDLLRIQFREHNGYESPKDPRWLLMRKLLEAIIEIAGKKPIILAPLPYHQIYKNPPYYNRFVELALTYNNVYLANVLDAFKKVPNTDILDFKRDQHYSEVGHQLIADVLTKTVIDNKIIATPATVVPEKPTVKKSNDNYILGISGFYHDAAAALIKNGEIVAAAQEERFTRVKNDARFPALAINFCLEKAGIHADQLSSVVFYDNPYLTFERLWASQVVQPKKGDYLWQQIFPKWVQTKLHIPDLIKQELMYEGPLYLTHHHLSHAASAYYPSPFTHSAILTIDGVGEWATASIALASGRNIKILKQMNFPHSAGLLYSAFTYYTGFKVNEGEYKLMGLAPYGEPVYADLIKKEIVDIHDDGSLTLNLKYFSFQYDTCMINDAFETVFGAKARREGEPITKHTRDIAKSIQVVTEEIVLKIATYAKKITGADYLCMAGGVALNCVANGKLIASGLFKQVWIQPASGDAGGALGAALACHYQFTPQPDKERKSNQHDSCLGPSFSDEEIMAFLDSFGYAYHVLPPTKRNSIIAQQIAEGKIVGHFAGGTEFGPRALGARSILADPRSETTQSSLNLKIKFRESFRPFAPSVLEEEIPKYFKLDQPSPFMLVVAKVNEERCIIHRNDFKSDLFEIVNQKRSDLPAITHVDYTARIQSVNKETNPQYYDLINEFKKITGYGVVINTSFNVNGEPIVCTPRDAVNCFMNTHMDILVLNNIMLLKTEQALPMKQTETKKNLVWGNKKQEFLKKQAIKFLRQHRSVSAITSAQSCFSGNIAKQGWQDVLPEMQTITEAIPLYEMKADDVLAQWQQIPKNERHLFKPMTNQMLHYAKKYKEETAVADNKVADNMYVMF